MKTMRDARILFLLTMLLSMFWVPGVQAQDRGVPRQLELNADVSDELVQYQLASLEQFGVALYSPKQVAVQIRKDVSVFGNIKVGFLDASYLYTAQPVRQVVGKLLSKLEGSSTDPMEELERYFLAGQLMPGMFSDVAKTSEIRFIPIGLGQGTDQLGSLEDVLNRAINSERLVLRERNGEEYLGGAFHASRTIAVMKALMRGR